MDRIKAQQLARELVGKMTVEERASQLRFDAPAIERLGVPAYNWWNEALHGVARAGTATVFPQAIGMAAMFDPDLLEQIGDAVSTEARARYNAISEKGDRDIYKGLTMWSPNVNIFRDPRWGRGHETYGEDPYLTGELGKAYVRGLQGKGNTIKVAACAKHFAVHSGPEDLRHHFDAVVSKKDMFETYLPAFEELVNEDVEAVMGAYNRVNGEPCCGSETLLRKILREKWGFKGHVVSDCWAVRDFHEGHKVTSKPTESVTLALSNGCDVNCGCTYQFVMEAYAEGKISEEQITESAVRLFTTRYLLGLLGTGSEYDAIPYSEVESKEHLALAYKAAVESCVLLKNDGILPLDTKKYKTIGVIGPNANSRAALIGNYYGTSSRYITVLEGIQDYVADDARILYADGCHLIKDRTEPLACENDRLAEALVVADNSDVIVAVVGLDESLEGEEYDQGNAVGSGDKQNLLLPKVQMKLLNELTKTGKPMVVILMAGSAIDMSCCADKANALIDTFYPGARGGKAVADILFGSISPSGKLPITFYYDNQLSEIGEFTDYSMTNKTYRYFQGKPMYPFGYGLTYSDVKLSNLECDGKTVSLKAENVGQYDVAEVIQVYVRDVESKLEVANSRLCAFKRVEIGKGECVSIDIPLGEKTFTLIDEEGERVSGSGKYEIEVGTRGYSKENEQMLSIRISC